MRELTLVADDISCEHCQKTIESDLSTMPGIHAVSVDIPEKAVRVEYDEGSTDEKSIAERMSDLGYPVATPG